MQEHLSIIASGQVFYFLLFEKIEVYAVLF